LLRNIGCFFWAAILGPRVIFGAVPSTTVLFDNTLLQNASNELTYYRPEVNGNFIIGVA